MMMIPRRNSFSLLDDIFRDPFFGHDENRIMRTDIKENENGYSLIVDLPGYAKENIKIDIDEGYLTIHATMDTEMDEKEESKFVRKERYFGECSRSFYVGDNIEPTDIKANFHNGTLNLNIPKKEEVKKLPEKKYVQIED